MPHLGRTGRIETLKTEPILSGWQKIENTKALHGTPALIYCPFAAGDGAIFMAMWDEYAEPPAWYDRDEHYVVCMPDMATHWMPLPAAPE